jgi:hypothetical protein
MTDRLQEMMQQLAGEHARLSAPPEVEVAVLAEFTRVQRRRRAVVWSVQAGAIAAALAIAVSLSWRTNPVDPTPQPVVQAEEPYVAIPYVTPLAPYERAQVVRMQLPVAALIAAGVPVRATDAGVNVEADVLVGQDGRARAFRLISE